MTSYLVADIGGTNARCARAAVDPKQRSAALSDTRTYRCAELESIDAMLARYGNDTEHALPSHVSLAVAGPVTGDRITLTNNDWNFSTEQLRRRFAFADLVVMNDLAAVAYATRFLHNDDLLAVKSGSETQTATRAVIGVGTGLGTAALHYAKGSWRAIASEGGHATFAPVTRAETEAANALVEATGAASWENMLSGPGLVHVYRTVANMAGRHDSTLGSHDIVRLAIENDDRYCVRAVQVFCRALARFASDAALWFGATGGVYLAGHLLRDLSPWLADEAFAVHFSDKGVMSDLIETIPVSLILADQPGLIGAAAGAQTLRNDVDQRAPSAIPTV
ncbi:MAG: glucokinase [Gammaproteobacteria bacterium]